MSDEMRGERRVETWLAVVGIGEDGIDGLSPAARALVAQAELVVGGRRHLALAGDLAAETVAWPSPIEGALDVIEARRGRPVCVLASGDPFFFGVGAMLMRRFSPEEMLCLPAPSAFALAAARLGWSQQDLTTLSLHGRPLEAILPHLQPGQRILALSWDEATPAKLAALLAARGMGRSRLTVCEAMGGPRERIRASEAESFALDNIAALNTIALDVIADRGAKILPRAPGLPDDWFEHEGQITKRDIRAVTLSALAPRRGEVLWDVGAGSGSIGIEWMLADPANRAVAIEADAERAARAARNALSLGVPALEVVVGRAPEAFRDLGTPDAVFIGGGAAGAIEAAAAALRPGGRLVVNAVTLETQALLVEERAKRGGDLVQIAVAHAEPVGRFTGWRAAMPIVQWRWTRP
jgi:precorrin-6Y C5,15-methyltransferase (decarboxylating)